MILVLCLLAQDLWEQARPKASTDRGRAELRMGPLIDRGGGSVRPARVDFDLGTDVDFACGRFDLKTSFRSVINKDIGGQLLGSAMNELRDHLAGSAMVLACQMSPTLCDALKHFRVTANDLLAMQLGECRSIEDRLDGPARSLRARALADCLAEKQAAGLALDEALAACRATPEVRGLTGRRGREVDLARELGEAFRLSPDSRPILDELLDSIRLSASGVRGDVKLRAVDAAYERGRRRYEDRHASALQGKSAEGLAPRSLPAVTQAELDALKVLEPPTRASAIASISAQYALIDVSELVHEVQSLLESAAAMSDDPALRETLLLQSSRLSQELRRLVDARELADRALEARAAVRAVSRADRADASRRNTAAWRYETAGRQQAQDRPWFQSCPEPLCPEKKK